jgi:hypothetical protein
MLALTANLSDKTIAAALREAAGIAIWGDAHDSVLKPWSVFWRLEPR